MKKLLSTTICCILLLSPNLIKAQSKPVVVYQNSKFAIYPDSVTQEKTFLAQANSSTELISNYKSPANNFQSSVVIFKLSINGKDNEMSPGVDHQFNCVGTVNTTPIVNFGEQLKLDGKSTAAFLLPDTKFTLRVDMRKPLADMNTQGYFTTYNGNKIYKDDFKGLFVAGPTAPMMWDFDNLVNKPELRLTDTDGDGIYQTTLILNKQEDEKQTASSWKQNKDTKAFPQYKSDFTLSNAIYNLSLEEMMNAVEPDSTFRTGKEWAGVWTRDISYSIILSMAYLQPQVAMYSLMRKVNKLKKIIQDTGTGGAYPASTDRMIWATAAWEIYKATGDKNWLKQSFEIIQNSIEDDILNAYDSNTGLVRGESSFLDWREQTYPRWMQPVDIYASKNLGTNAVHYNANMVIATIAKTLNNNKAYTKYSALAQKIKTGINQYFWQPNKGYYGQFIYGRNYPILSSKSEALGEALCILFDIASPDQQKTIVRSTPVMDFGVPTVYPQIPGIPPYHNNSVWPFVQSYWMLAAAKAGNEKSVMASIAAIYRPAAMFLTNKENFVAENGDFAGTQINSSNMLWSLSGNLAVVHKVLFGIQFQEEALTFNPFVPYALRGRRTLNNFKYRNAVLNIELSGFGSTIKSFMVDGKPQTNYSFAANQSGEHSISIELSNEKIPASTQNEVGAYTTLNTPQAAIENQALSWAPIKGAKQYLIYQDGKNVFSTSRTQYAITSKNYAEYMVIAEDENGVPSFASEPVAYTPTSIILETEKFYTPSNLPYKGASGEKFVETNTTINTRLNFPVTIQKPGWYAVQFKYANGNGPTNTSNKCAIRSLYVNKQMKGAIVLPQRGYEEWSNWGNTNAIQVYLKKGKQNISLEFKPWNNNMNLEVNQAMIDYMELTRIQ